MSVTPAGHHTANTEFFALLSRHPELEQWLITHSQQEPAVDTEDLHGLFLQECSRSGISEHEYPFAVDDRGKSDLLDFYEQLPQRPMQLSPDMLAEDTMATVMTHPGETGPIETPPEKKTRPLPLLEPGAIEADESAVSTVNRPLREDTAGDLTASPGAQDNRPVDRSSKKRRIPHMVLLAIILLGIFVPIGFAAGVGIDAYRTYSDLRNEAHDGVQHLLNVKTIFTGAKTHPGGLFDTNRLHSAQKELHAANSDFQQLQQTLDHSSLIHNVATFLPQYLPQIRSARAASQIGIDACAIGQEVINTALILAPSLHGSLLTSTGKPLVTQNTLNLLGTTIDEVLPELRDIMAQSQQITLSALPVSAQERDEFAQLLQALPQVTTDLTQAHDLLGAAGWILGVDQPRTFLVQTMDRAELRPTGGFTGQYGELTISGGRVAPFALKDISLIEYADNSPTLGNLAPSQYRSWWPFANWGLRDSNLSADFPTSAQIAITQYRQETGHVVDGDILFTPMLIEHILTIIGPIPVSAYNEVITAQNLENRLHYYQQDNAGIAKQAVVQPDNKVTSNRKRFTSLLAQLLVQKIRQAPPDELLAIAREALYDLKTRDLQVYFTNPQIEGLLMQYGDAGQMDRSTTHDGLYIVQANVSASKASQYVQTSLNDTVTLNAEGGATHVLRMRLMYTQIGPVYGYDTYRDYVRIYVPPTSKFLWGDGFDTGTPLCGGPYAPCPASGVYRGNELVCPSGQYEPGAAAPSNIDPSGGDFLPLDTIGPPTTLTSDEPGRAMFGGYVVVPKNCAMTITVSWYVPPMGNHPYALLVQRQAGTFPALNLTILPTPANCTILGTSGLYFNGILSDDRSFTVPQNRATAKDGRPQKAQDATGCYPQNGI
ncbi:MAG TPA: DUF4012 domain-containing protein [Ktedonobacteraceae bacterium]|nr:DUF4012 domain-containing protein [Ktedonobacteraceae bacterium]